MLLKWIEKRPTNGVKAAYVPKEAHKWICHKLENHLGQIALRFEKMTGIALPSNNFSYEDNWNDIDEIGIGFYDLEEIEQKLIISYLDPFNQLKTRRDWTKFYAQNNIYNDRNYKERLKFALMKLQIMAEARELTIRMEDVNDELRGWEEICEFMGFSFVTTRSLAIEHGAPIIRLGGSVRSSKKRLGEWMNYLYSKGAFSNSGQMCKNGCEKVVRAKGLCSSCYYKKYRKGRKDS